MFDFEKFISTLTNFYYTPLLMLIVELLALIIAIKFGRKNKIGRIFIFYIAFDFLISCTDSVLFSLSTVSRKNLTLFANYTNTLIALVELYTYYYFFFSVLINKKIRRSIFIIGTIYLVLVIIYLISGFGFLTPKFKYVTYLLGAIEFIFLIPFCFLNFNQILHTDSKIKMLERPSFLITTGIFFYTLISIPYYLLIPNLLTNYSQLIIALGAALYYIPFTINFIFIIKAFLCKKPLTI